MSSRVDRATKRASDRAIQLSEARKSLATFDALNLSESGLTQSQVAERTRLGLDNRQERSTSRGVLSILRANIFTLFNAVIGGSALLLIALGQWKDALFGFAGVFNVLIGVIQELRAKTTLDKLALLHETKAKVRREYQRVEVPVSEVVLDDVLDLQPGDQIVADAILLQGFGLEVDESLLTGESDPVAKRVGDQLLTGSSVLAGKGSARVAKLGPETYASRLSIEARRFSLVNSELRNELNHVIKWITWAIVPILLIVSNGQMQAVGGWQKAFETGKWVGATVAAVAGITTLVPQGLVLLTSIAFAVAAVKLSRRNVLLQELAAVEGLARVDVICFDKTGTLTEGEIVFDSIIAMDAGLADRTHGLHDANRVLGVFADDPDANATAKSLRANYSNNHSNQASERDLPTISSSIAFDSTRKWSAFGFAAQGEKPEQLWVLGAPELVLNPDDSSHSASFELAQELADAGKRTLVLAASKQPARDSQLPAKLVAIALLTFAEKVRPDAKATLDYFRAQGVSLRIISGDNPKTVASVVRQTLQDPSIVGIDARELAGDSLADCLETELVFGRVTPEQKRDMVLAMQSRGHVVAMVGDGVNDALALKRADLGIAMGTGSEATKAVANLVLLDSNFAALPGVVAEGRRVIANIERVSRLFLTKTVWAIVLALVFGALMWVYPFAPRHLTVLDVFMIGVPSFFLALQPNAQLYRAGFMRRALAFCLPAGLAIGLAVIGLDVANQATGLSRQQSQTATSILIAISGLWVLTVLARPFRGWSLPIVAAMYALFIASFTITPFSDFIGFTRLTPAELVAPLGLGLLVCAIVEILNHFISGKLALPSDQKPRLGSQ